MNSFQSFLQLFVLLLNISTFCLGSHYPYVTWGSVIKLINNKYSVRLHSHDIKYGSGSGQQSVTGSDSKSDVNSHWVIKPVKGTVGIRGEMIPCGSKIEIEHMSTKRNLHSHLFQSPLSSNQEVSCFGEEGVGDTGDSWIVVCQDDGWRRDDTIKFKHVDTNAYLAATNQKYGRPIHGQHEVVSTTYSDDNCLWKAGEGIYVQPNDFLKKLAEPEVTPKQHVHEHTEF